MDIQVALKKLNSIVYHEEIGSLANKVDRVRRLTNILTQELNFTDEQKQASDRAAEICKFDLVTNMVNEFPELQGLMGEKYARQKGEKEAVALAINEHYMPRNADDETPESDTGAVLSIAEKVDTIASFFAIGMIPSGSQDPYALRRQATGVVQTLLHKDWKIKLEDIIQKSLSLLEAEGIMKQDIGTLSQELIIFFKLRLKHLLQEKGVRYDLIDAVLGSEVGVTSTLVQKAEVLEEKKNEEDFKENMEALSRVLNIASKATESGEVQEDLFENEYERQLYEKYLAVNGLLNETITEEHYFELLVSMKSEISQYFDHTMVMAENEVLKQNRLNLMVKLSEIIRKFANVNEILVK